MTDDLLISLSAYADGELPAAARAEFEQQLTAHPEWQRELAQFKALDAAAARLPVPDASAKLATLPGATELRAACDAPLPAQLVQELHAVPEVKPKRFDAVWQAIAARTIALQHSDAQRASALADGELSGDAAALASNPQLAREMALWKRLDAATAKLPVPTLPEATARESAGELAARISALQHARAASAGAPNTQPAVPAISPEKWDRVWQKIEARVSVRPAASVPSNVVPLPQPIVRHASRWRWAVASSIAAALAVALLLKFLPHLPHPPATPDTSATQTSGDDTVALELPRPVNDRYDITIEYVKGDPVVCYYLKPEERPSDPNRDWRWLPD